MAYEKDTDYQALINAAVEAGNMKDAAKYEQQRNAKIAGEGINARLDSIDESIASLDERVTAIENPVTP